MGPRIRRIHSQPLGWQDRRRYGLLPNYVRHLFFFLLFSILFRSAVPLRCAIKRLYVRSSVSDKSGGLIQMYFLQQLSSSFSHAVLYTTIAFLPRRADACWWGQATQTVCFINRLLWENVKNVFETKLFQRSCRVNSVNVTTDRRHTNTMHCITPLSTKQTTFLRFTAFN